jgi:NAD(P)-dependent dehydrogenase (short-subunit alcohol dehydrogenase family)
VPTDMGTVDPKALQGIIEEIPLRRIAAPQDIARVAVFLASDLAGYVNGQVLCVDGGRHM